MIGQVDRSPCVGMTRVLVKGDSQAQLKVMDSMELVIRWTQQLY